MSDSPDISKVISLLMQNPEIIANIGAMLSSHREEQAPISQESMEEVAAAPSPEEPSTKKRSSRAALLGAMKPYLRESRANAVDSMISILDVLEAMRR